MEVLILVSSDIYYLISFLALLLGDFISFSLVPRPLLQPTQLICGRDKLQVGLDMAAMTSALNPLPGNPAACNGTWVRVRDDVVRYEVEAQAGSSGNTQGKDFFLAVSLITRVPIK